MLQKPLTKHLLTLSITAITCLSPNNSIAFQHSKSLPYLALSLPGEVSLGAYQGGFLYYAFQTAKQNKIATARVISGTSAGSLNALLATIESCDNQVVKPEDSLFYRTWLPLGIGELYRDKDSATYNLFSRQYMDSLSLLIKERWDRGLPTSCSVKLGIAATRLNQLKIELANGLYAYRASETFTMDIKGRGHGTPPLVTNLVDTRTPHHQVMLPFTDDTNHNFNIIKTLVYASSAVPLVFPSQLVDHCLVNPGQIHGFKCTAANSKPQTFIDGGVYDNNPLAHTLEIIHRLPPSEQKRFIVGIIDSNFKSYPDIELEEKVLYSKNFFDNIGTYLANFIKNSRARKISDIYQKHPDISKRIVTNKNTMPLMGATFASFFGFFERDFRLFDFYIGMYDARQYLNSFFQRHFPRQAMHSFPDTSLPESFQEFSCIKDTIDGDFVVPKLCHQTFDQNPNLLVMLQVSIVQLYNHCRQIEVSTTHQAQCELAKEGKLPPALIPLFNPNTWRQDPRETKFAYPMRLLAEYGFAFKDLGLTSTESMKGPSQIFNKIAAILDSYGKRNKKDEFVLAALMLKSKKNVFDYFAFVDLSMRCFNKTLK